jgi:hypothetical protein
MSIMHNAGVTGSGELFYKANYMNKLPYGEQLEIKENTASRKYWDIIVKIGKNSCLIK